MRGLQEEIDTAAVLGLRTGSRMFRHAFTILGKPWDPSKSTAQPPYACRHEREQLGPGGNHFRCCACGWPI